MAKKKSKNTKDVEHDVRGIDYSNELRECIKSGYAHLSDPKDEKQRLQVRESCRSKGKKKKK